MKEEYNFLKTDVLPKLSLKAVLFDMDGVLYNSMPSHACAWKQTCDFYGIASTQEDFYAMEGANAFYTVDCLFRKQYGHGATPEDAQRVYEKKTEFFERMTPPSMMTGADKVLAQVKASGLEPAIVTGSSQRALLDRIERAYPGVFSPEHIVTGDMVRRGKPDPEPYLTGMARTGCSSTEALVVENAPLGIQSGKAAGLVVIVVNTGPLKDEVLLEAGADMLFHTMEELAVMWPKVMEVIGRVNG